MKKPGPNMVGPGLFSCLGCAVRGGELTDGHRPGTDHAKGPSVGERVRSRRHRRHPFIHGQIIFDHSLGGESGLKRPHDTAAV